MDRELGIDARDLPHGFTPGANPKICRICNHGQRWDLHHVEIEQASHREVLQTEKGS